ncbi:hypothetical protein GBA52_016426 [Prunus armeniaca]|nr:hypothetical protein GBA52_016426 [Prunus armeniaca]
MKVELKPFTGKENFTLWQKMIKSDLTQQNLSVVLGGKEKKPITMTNEEWGVLDELARGALPWEARNFAAMPSKRSFNLTLQHQHQHA